VRPLHRQATWAEIVALYRLTLDRPPHNLQPNYNLCPTDPIDVVTDLTSIERIELVAG
jgi:hypothetical protein